MANEYPAPIDFQLRLGSIKSTKSSMAKIIRQYSKGLMSHIQFRNLIYGFSSFLSVCKMDNEQETERRIGRLETIICERLPDGSYGKLITGGDK